MQFNKYCANLINNLNPFILKLVAIFHCWDDWYLLRHAVENMRQLVDGIIIIGSTLSNYGEYSEIPDDFKNEELFIREPIFHHPMNSETDKRNYGLTVARKQGYTHFITCDSDELYKPFEFTRAWSRFLDDPKLKGLVIPCNVYFKSPTLTIGRDITLVPFIHELTPTIKHEFNRKYPYAWDREGIRIDPTRSFNILSGVQYTEEVVMEHYSWVRQDVDKKIRNSSARNNIERSTLKEDYLNAKAGYYCSYYHKILTECPNYFGIEMNASHNLY